MTSRTLSQALAVMRKELRDGVRDRRAVFSLLFGATVGPLLVGAILTFMAGRVRDAQDVSIPVVGGTHAPALVQWLRQQPGVTVTPGPANPEEAIRSQAEDVVVVIPDDYEIEFAAYRPVEISVLADSSRTAARPTCARRCCATSAPRLPKTRCASCGWHALPRALPTSASLPRPGRWRRG